MNCTLKTIVILINLYVYLIKCELFKRATLSICDKLILHQSLEKSF